jgi:hypothetical protein
MLERERDFTPVTASIVNRHVLARGSQEKVVENILRKEKEEHDKIDLFIDQVSDICLRTVAYHETRTVLRMTAGDSSFIRPAARAERVTTLRELRQDHCPACGQPAERDMQAASYVML